jgi:hypothetical protein
MNADHFGIPKQGVSEICEKSAEAVVQFLFSWIRDYAKLHADGR